ncbi:phosphatidic acid phosphatase type 2 domain-containing protein 1A [Coprinopsis sp. MPI-PUGE-AT-0042]|nr:phosphatidic acid phosphatase type 2 domain-containing protein 1A [Coprinopsis sp. MPI-PUGE-AT-0042]
MPKGKAGMGTTSTGGGVMGRFHRMVPNMYPTTTKAMDPTRRKRLLLSYAPDWVVTLLIAGAFYALDKVNGYRREFSLTDTSLRYPHAEHERVPNGPLYFIVFGIPIILQPIINFLTVRSWWDLHNSSLGLILGLALTGATTQFIKVTVGRPRPDIISRCMPSAGALDPEFGLFNWTMCTQPDDSVLNEGFRSFPSGHSSMSFAGLGFLAFYLAGKLHLFDERGHAGKAWVSIFPFFGAAMVAISRTMDYRHHWHDVIVGSFLGILMSFFAYRQYYPPLTSEVSHRPYSPRIKDDSDLSGDSDSPILPTTYAQGQSSGYNPASYNGGGGYQSGSNRYNHTPSPPPNPFGSDGRKPGGSSYDNVKLGVDGTVQRPGQGQHLEEMWKDSGDGYEGTVPRPRSREGSHHDSDISHSKGGSGQMTTRELQQGQRGAVMTAGSPPVTPFVNAQENSFSIPLRKTATGTSQEPQTRGANDEYQSAYDGIR